MSFPHGFSIHYLSFRQIIQVFLSLSACNQLVFQSCFNTHTFKENVIYQEFILSLRIPRLLHSLLSYIHLSLSLSPFPLSILLILFNHPSFLRLATLPRFLRPSLHPSCEFQGVSLPCWRWVGVVGSSGRARLPETP